MLFQSDAGDAADYGLITETEDDEEKNQNTCIVIMAAELINMHDNLVL